MLIVKGNRIRSNQEECLKGTKTTNLIDFNSQSDALASSPFHDYCFPTPPPPNSPQIKTARGNVSILAADCFLPRMMFSPEDALYCAKLPQLLHELEVPSFSTLFFYNEVRVWQV